MIRAEDIPDEVVKAALLTDERLGMREVIAAAINAWPGAWQKGDTGTFQGAVPYPAIILPQKGGDA